MNFKYFLGIFFLSSLFSLNVNAAELECDRDIYGNIFSCQERYNPAKKYNVDTYNGTGGGYEIKSLNNGSTKVCQQDMFGTYVCK
ncbi:MAG: hypothetical protein ACI4V7_09340 [Succinivibrionaceae bacterium]